MVAVSDKKPTDIVSMCSALMDVLIRVEDKDIESLGLTKGRMHLVSAQEQQKVMDYFKDHPHQTELGGSCLNTMRALAALGRKATFAGMIGTDTFGRKIEERLNQLQIRSKISQTTEDATGLCLILVTPDGERTMNTSLGAARLYGKGAVPYDEISNAKVFHFSGYQWDTEAQKEAILAALKCADQNGVMRSFDLADPFVVTHHRDALVEIIQNHADVIFANREESKLLFGLEPEETAKKIAAMGPLAVIKLGKDGSLLCNKGMILRTKALPAEVVDTTGAGDMFAAGFLHGLLKKAPWEQCLHTASLLASDVIGRMGATLSEEALAKAR